MEHEEASAPDTGFIKLFRTLQDCSFAHRPEYMSAWVHILLLASHKPHRTMLGNKTIQLQPGQFVSGRKALAVIVGVSEKQMRGILDFFVDERMLTKSSSRAGTVFTVCKYSEFQEKQGQEGPTVSGQEGGQHKGQAKPGNSGALSEIGAKDKANDGANKGPSKRATLQENKNLKSKEKDNAPAGASLPTKDEAQPERKASAAAEFTTTLITKGVTPELADEYAKVRKAKRLPLSAGAISLLEREAAKASHTLASAVETCVLRGWGGFRAEWLENAAAPQRSGPSTRTSLPRNFGAVDYAQGLEGFDDE